MNKTEFNVKKLFGNKEELIRGGVDNDPYFVWYDKNKEVIKSKGGLVEYQNDFGDSSKLFFQIGDFSLYRCDKTGFIYANPRMTTVASKPFFDEFMSKYFESVENTVKERRELSYTPLASLLSEFMPKGKLLEVGCGSGALMHLLSTSYGFDIEGVEISSAAKKYHIQRNQKVYECGIEELGLINMYDGIYMWSVADHFSDPSAAFSSCYKALKHNGVMVVANINTDGFDIKTMGSDSVIYTPPGRVNYYNLKSLKIQLEKVGFRVKSQKTIGKLDVKIVQKYFEDKKINENDGFIENLILNKQMEHARENFQTFLQENNLSGSQVLVAIKD